MTRTAMDRKDWKTIHQNPEAARTYWETTAEEDFSDEGFWKFVDAALYDHSWITTVNAFIRGGNLAAASDLLEVGCGWGRSIVGVKKRFPGLRVTGIDLVERFLSRGRLVLERELGSCDVTLQQGNANDLDFADGSFDAVCTTRVLQYVEEPVRVLREFHRVLRPGGRAVVLLPNKLNALQAMSYHAILYSPGDIAGWFRDAGFRVLRKRSVGFIPSRFLRIRYTNPLSRGLEAFCQSIPLINRTGGLAWVYGEKPR